MFTSNTHTPTLKSILVPKVKQNQRGPSSSTNMSCVHRCYSPGAKHTKRKFLHTLLSEGAQAHFSEWSIPSAHHHMDSLVIGMRLQVRHRGSATMLSSSHCRTLGGDPSKGLTDQSGFSSSGCLSFCANISAN
jgi:hypothetical protein